VRQHLVLYDGGVVDNVHVLNCHRGCLRNHDAPQRVGHLQQARICRQSVTHGRELDFGSRAGCMHPASLALQNSRAACHRELPKLAPNLSPPNVERSMKPAPAAGLRTLCKNAGVLGQASNPSGIASPSSPPARRIRAWPAIALGVPCSLSVVWQTHRTADALHLKLHVVALVSGYRYVKPLLKLLHAECIDAAHWRILVRSNRALSLQQAQSAYNSKNIRPL
jgi:hypothetical protein